MPGEAFTIGPFKDGIRLGMLGNPDSTTDATDIINFDVLNDGTLRSRRMQRQITGVTPASLRLELIGTYYDPTGKPWLVGSTTGGTYVWDGTGSFTRITTNVAVACVQYRNYLWLVCEFGTSGKWQQGGTFTAVTGMPLGRSCVIKGDRLFVAEKGPNSRLVYSQSGTLDNWEGAGGGYIMVRPQDGAELQKLCNYNDQIVIFKNSSINILSFTGDPGSGAMRLVSPIVGTPHRKSAVAREDTVIFFHDGKIYGLNNNTLVDLGRPLIEDFNSSFPSSSDIGNPSSGTDSPAPLTLINLFLTFLEGNKLLVHIDGYNYVFHVESNAWTRYDFGSHQIGNVVQIRNWSDGAEWRWYAGARDDGDNSFYQFMHPEIPGNSPGMTLLPFTCRMRTKGLILGSSANFKRLFHWGVDCSFRGNMVGTIFPVSTHTPATWAQIHTKKWSELAQWNAPLGYSAAVVADTYDSNYPQRSYIKFPKGLRFRRAIFQVEFTRNIDFCLLYTLSAYAGVRELVYAKET